MFTDSKVLEIEYIAYIYNALYLGNKNKIANDLVQVVLLLLECVIPLEPGDREVFPPATTVKEESLKHMIEEVWVVLAGSDTVGGKVHFQ